MNLGKFVSFCIMLFVVSSMALAQDMPMKNNMMKDSSDKKMMMEKEKMMHDDMMISKNEEGVAIKGYDPVGYFVDGKAEMGMMKHSYKWGGATWYFTSKDHMLMFEKDPAKYTPQYGGHCAFGASEGHLANGDPTAWTIEDGKLYLNSNSDVCKSFEMDYKSRVMKADKYWKDAEQKEGM